MTILTSWPTDEPILEVPVDDPDAEADAPTAELTEDEMREVREGDREAVRRAIKMRGLGRRPILGSSGLVGLIGGTLV